MVSRRLSRGVTQITIRFVLKTDLVPLDSPCSLSYSCGLVLLALLKVLHLCDSSPLSAFTLQLQYDLKPLE